MNPTTDKETYITKMCPFCVNNNNCDKECIKTFVENKTNNNRISIRCANYSYINYQQIN